MKNWTKVVSSVAFAAIGSVALAAGAYAQETFEMRPPPCIIVADIARLADGTQFTSAGDMALLGIETSSPDESIQWMNFISTSFNATTNDPAFGQITWALDDSRPATSRIQSDQEGALFPASIDLVFNVRATVATADGGVSVYLSREPVRMRNVIPVVSFPPCPTRLIAVAPIDFYAENNPDETAFTVTQLESNINN